MKNLTGASVLVVAALVLASPAWADGNTDADTAGSAATVITPITITPGNGLRFGQFVQPTASGTLEISLTGGLTPDGGMSSALIGITQLSPGRGPGTFTVAGQAGRSYQITLPATATLTLSGGSQTMTVSSLRRTGGASARTLPVAGSEVITVAGTLDVGANQAVGSYSGTFNVTVTYQ